jgi:hypothetical protein
VIIYRGESDSTQLYHPFLKTYAEGSEESYKNIEKRSTSASDGLRLPYESRLMCLEVAIPRKKQDFYPYRLLATISPSSVCEPSGFYFPLAPGINALLVNEQIRQESLPFISRRLQLTWYDIDDFIKFAISIGKTGRDNVESVNVS